MSHPIADLRKSYERAELDETRSHADPLRQFGLMKVRFRGLAKNTAHVLTLFALSNLWMARRQLMAMLAVVRPRTA